MNPNERVRFVVETAKAVLDERIAADEAAEAIGLQAEQIAPMLRGDRIDVTQAEADDVATKLRLLAEQVNDHASRSCRPRHRRRPPPHRRGHRRTLPGPPLSPASQVPGTHLLTFSLVGDRGAFKNIDEVVPA
ncbi:MAG: hypothetical protein U5R31_08220 [Acidimicrobiia bacterium]|nr:hypothetical protein [Acidimicrobiia bacterium]